MGPEWFRRCCPPPPLPPPLLLPWYASHLQAQITLTEELFVRLVVQEDPTAAKQIGKRKAYLLKKGIPYKHIRPAIRAAVADEKL